MKKLLLFGLLLLLCSTAHAQRQTFWAMNTPGNSTTNFFTLQQANGGPAVSSGGSYTPTNAIGSGHAVVIIGTNDSVSNSFLSAITGGCSVSWQFPSNAQAGSGNGSVSFAVCTNSSSASSVTLTTSDGNLTRPFIYEYSFTLASSSLDCSGNAVNSQSSGNLTGATLSSCTGTKDVVVQSSINTACTGVNSPFGNWLANTGGSNDAADNENTASPGTAPTHTGCSGANTPVAGVALK